MRYAPHITRPLSMEISRTGAHRGKQTREQLNDNILCQAVKMIYNLDITVLTLLLAAVIDKTSDRIIFRGVENIILLLNFKRFFSLHRAPES